MKILIIGATGGTGRIMLEKALEQDHQVTALARNPSAVAPRDYRPRVLLGNVLDPDAVEAAVARQDAVLSALGTRSTKPTMLFSVSTANLVSAMRKHVVRRLVCLTGIGAGDSKAKRCRSLAVDYRIKVWGVGLVRRSRNTQPPELRLRAVLGLVRSVSLFTLERPSSEESGCVTV